MGKKKYLFGSFLVIYSFQWSAQIKAEFYCLSVKVQRGNFLFLSVKIKVW